MTSHARAKYEISAEDKTQQVLNSIKKSVGNVGAVLKRTVLGFLAAGGSPFLVTRSNPGRERNHHFISTPWYWY